MGCSFGKIVHMIKIASECAKSTAFQEYTIEFEKAYTLSHRFIQHKKETDEKYKNAKVHSKPKMSQKRPMKYCLAGGMDVHIQ